MTLNDIANFVCTKVGQPDSASLTVCQGFINARYRQVWEAAAWRETLAMASVLVAQDGSGIAVLPQGLDRVMSVRASSQGSTTLNNFLPPFELNVLFQYDATLWDASPGNPVFFSTIDPTAIPNQMGQTTGYGLQQGYDYVTVATVQCPTSISGAEAQAALDAGAVVYVAGLDVNGNYQEVTVSLGSATLTNAGGGNYYWACSGTTAQLFTEVSMITKAATANGILATWSTAAGSIYTPGGGNFLRPGDTSGPTFERIKLLSPPAAGSSNAVTLLVLGKKRFTALQNPSSAPILRSCSNVLIAMATGDMLERQRQYAKAQAKFAEGKEQMEILLDIERNQAASDIRIIPAQTSGGWDDAETFGSQGKGFC